jgi:hypothetical protein
VATIKKEKMIKMKRLNILFLGMWFYSCYGSVSPQAYAQWITNFIQAEKDLDPQIARENQLLLEGAYYYMLGDVKGLAEVEEYARNKKIFLHEQNVANFIQGLPMKVSAIFNRKFAGITPQETKERYALARKRYYAKEYTGAVYATTLQEIGKKIKSFSEMVQKDKSTAAALLDLIEQIYDQAFGFYKFIEYEVQASDQTEAEKRFREYSIALKPGETPDKWLENQFKELKKIAESINDAGKKLSIAQDASIITSEPWPTKIDTKPTNKETDKKSKGPTKTTKEDLAVTAQQDDESALQPRLTQQRIDDFTANFKLLDDAIKNNRPEEARLKYRAVKSFFDTFGDVSKHPNVVFFNTKNMPKTDAAVLREKREDVEKMQAGY